MKKYIQFLAIFMLFSCQMAKEKAQNGLTSAMEEVIENQTGEKVDLATVKSATNNKTVATLSIEGIEKLDQVAPLIGSVTGQKEESSKLVSVQLTGEDGSMAMVILKNFPEHMQTPHTFKFYKQNEVPDKVPSAQFTFMKVSDEGIFSYIAFEGTITLDTFSEEKIEATLNGKGGDAIEIENNKSWKEFSSTITIYSPIIQTIGFEKSEILN